MCLGHPQTKGLVEREDPCAFCKILSALVDIYMVSNGVRENRKNLEKKNVCDARHVTAEQFEML